ncbi:MAG: CsgG/HfaB family protein [Candidatus Omnitrophica bacterium]|nr:CsgG/HfaB family protein [Candidatus Omnitrophota bacterium]
MKIKYFVIIGCCFLILNLAGCAVLDKPVQFIGQAFFPPYSGPKATIIVADFEIKAAKATSDVGAGLQDMLIARLEKTNRFQIIAPKENTNKKAKLIIATEVIDFEPRASGGSEGVGGGGSAASGTLGSLLGVTGNKSTIALNIRIVDTASSKVLVSGRVAGQAIDTGSANRLRRGSALSEGLSAYNNTSMGEAINKCIAEAAEYIVQNVPAGYYKGG